MDPATQPHTLQLDSRLARSVGRAGRDRMANARVTNAELNELHAAARAQGKSLSEWSRELVATRLLLVNLIKPIITGQKVSEEWVSQAMSAVRQNKRKAAAEVRQQYRTEGAGGQ